MANEHPEIDLDDNPAVTRTGTGYTSIVRTKKPDVVIDPENVKRVILPDEWYEQMDRVFREFFEQHDLERGPGTVLYDGFRNRIDVRDFHVYAFGYAFRALREAGADELFIIKYVGSLFMTGDAKSMLKAVKETIAREAQKRDD